MPRPPRSIPFPLPTCVRRSLRQPATALLLLTLVGCTPNPHPLDGYSPVTEMREGIFNHHAAYFSSVRPARVSSDPPTGDVEAFLSKEGNLAEADKTSGMASYGDAEPDPGKDIMGRWDKAVQPMTLQRAVITAMQSGLDPRIAQLGPEIAEAKIEQARGAFDPVAFAETSVSRTQGRSSNTGGNVDTDNLAGKTGIKQKFLPGTLAEISGNLTNSTQSPKASAVDPWYESGLGLQVTQPLLRGAGLAVNRSEMDLASVAAKVERQRLRATLIKTTADAADAYWQLAGHRDEVLIQERMVQRTRALADRLRPRLGHDVLGSDMAQVITRLSTREGELDTARAALRDGSDRLKRLMDDPRAPLASERILLPQDRPEIKELELDLADAMSTAMVCRPDLAEAELGITDARIRLLVAKNAQLPLTDLKAGVTLHALDGRADTTISRTTSDATDAAISLRFEQALGNRSADALVAEQRGANRKAVLTYQRACREVLLEVKAALRKVVLAHAQISRTRATRRSASEALRVAEHRLKENPAGGDSYTTLIDRILDRQETLGRAEIEEARTRYNFMIALARLDEAMGVSMDRFGVETQMDEESTTPAPDAEKNAPPGETRNETKGATPSATPSEPSTSTPAP